jgi:hypothetical protein
MKTKVGICVLAIYFLCSCTTNRQILKAVNGLRADMAKIDSVTKQNQILYNYEKARIDSSYRNISDADLKRRIDALTRPKRNN